MQKKPHHERPQGAENDHNGYERVWDYLARDAMVAGRKPTFDAVHLLPHDASLAFVTRVHDKQGSINA